MARRIATFIPTLDGGGAERAVITLANGFAGRGYAVDIVLVQAVGAFLTHVAESVRIVELKPSGMLSGFSSHMQTAKRLPDLVRYLRRERPNAVLSALDAPNVVSQWAHAIARVPARFVISQHNTLRRRQALASPADVTWHIPRAYRRADVAVAVSEGVADSLVAVAGLRRERIVTIYNPIDVDVCFERSKERLDHPFALYDHRALVLAVGRLVEQKDYPTLLSAFARLRSQRPVKLAILGEGPLRGDVESIVETLGLRDDIALAGFTDNPFSWMRCADLFVMSSTREGLPTVLVEAMSCGAPIVSTDCRSGPREILEGGKWGRLVPVGDAEALAAAMGEALDDRSPPDGRQRATDFGVEKAVDAYLAVLRAT